MSGGHFNYVGSTIAMSLRDIAEDERMKKEFPELSKLLGELGEVLYQIEHDIDWDFEGDSPLQVSYSEYEKRAIGKLIDVVLKNSPDEWFPKGKWATIQAFQQRSGSEEIKVNSPF